uniref:MULE transposase domain-containing protein n=1 Tax=Lactuca sativa TaxID=4236 RepID=A0A9R1XU67_LACSA|nr:hypothetical protein LSAT_V11C200083050 [Lactuca sativa]
MSFLKSEHKESFNNLHVYLHNLRRTNLHSYTHIKTYLMDRFEACFVAIGWVIYLFFTLFYCFFKIENVSTSELIRFCFPKNTGPCIHRMLLPVIFICSVPLRGDYLKTMFVAVVIDRNNQTLPIAFGLVVENNLYYYTWFLMRLKEALTQGKEVVFITNMDNVISSCIEHVFLILIMSILLKNITTLFWMISNSNTMSDFEENFCRLTPDAHSTLMFPNVFLVLSVNQRNVPIITLTEAIRDYIQRNFVKRSLMAERLINLLTLYAEIMLHKRMQKCIRWQTTKIPPEI